MVDLAKVTKEDAKTAAIEFLGIFAMWTDCFFDNKAGARLLKLNEADYEGGDIHYDSVPIEPLKDYIANSHLHEAVFVKKIEQIFDFAKWGTGTTKTENGEYLIDGLYIYNWIIELGSFRHMFARDVGSEVSENTFPPILFKDDGLNMLDAWMGNKGLVIDILITITDAAYARWQLTEGGSLTLKEMALLAGVSIKTIRNAISSKGNDQLILKAGDKDIDSDEAYRWLITKKGFTGPFSFNEEPAYQSYEILGHFRHHCFVLRKLANLEIIDLSKAMKWNESLTEAYVNLENLAVTQSLALLTPQALMALGKFYQSKNLTTFVIEGSKILAFVVAELQAKTLFDDSITNKAINAFINEFGEPSRTTVKVKAWDICHALGAVIAINGLKAHIWLPYPPNALKIPDNADIYPSEKARSSNTYASPGLGHGLPALKLVVHSDTELNDCITFIKSFRDLLLTS